jgi:hypothetical protein
MAGSQDNSVAEKPIVPRNWVQATKRDAFARVVDPSFSATLLLGSDSHLIAGRLRLASVQEHGVAVADVIDNVGA